MDKKVNSPEANAPAAEKQQIDVHKLNVYQKLILARKRFLERGVKKSGINRKLEFQYFELADIVPSATRIFQNVGLLAVVQFPPVQPAAEGVPASEPVAQMIIVNVDKPSESIEFVVPYREVGQIVSNAGNTVTNPLQALGSSVTYLRRYLWMLALDVVEPDEVDATLDKPVPQEAPAKKSAPAQPSKKPSKPATPAERESIKVALTQADGAPDELMVKGLKAALKTLLQKDEKQNEFVQQVAEKTVGFTQMTRTQCENLVKTVQGMIAEYDKK